MVVLSFAGCGGDEGSKRPGGALAVGEARLATSDDRPKGLTSVERRNGALEGTPTTDDLKSSAPPAALGSEQSRCTGSAVQAIRANVAAMARPTLCLINAERRARGLGALRSNPQLARAAAAHARDMVRRSYFSHTSRSGQSFLDRIRRRGYIRRASAWTVGENLAWGAGPRSTPRSIVSAWMGSPGHRANILSRRFREIGVGITYGGPVRGDTPPVATYNTAFGARRRGR